MMEKTVQDTNFHFETLDYTVFSGMLLLSTLTGFYFGCRSKYCSSVEAPTLTEYLRGNGNMKPFPVAMSLIASYISGVTVLGTPSEIYNFGTQYWAIIFAICLSGIVVTFVYLPVFFKLQVYSSYEYLELRFNRAVRTVISVLFVIDEILFLPILIYVPSLAFNQVTGLDLHLIGTVVCLVCILYTVLGGLKAVVWTDTWQIVVMFISVIVIITLGTVNIGGYGYVWSKSYEGGRINFFNLNPSLYERQTLLSVIVGGFFYWTSFNSVNQTMVQRYLSLPSITQSKLSVGIFTLGVSFFVLVCCFSGLVVYATYYLCDPLSAGRIKADDQLLPLYVMETVGHLTGIPGLFIAGVFGAALSSLSVVLNSTSTVLLEDFTKGCMRMNLRERTASIFVKLIALILGMTAVGFLFIVEHLGGILSIATSLTAIAAGTSFGVFSLGMLFPWTNSKGAIVGAISGFLMSGWVSFGIQYAGASGIVVARKLPVSVEKCDEMYGINVTYIEPTYPDESDVFPLFRLSYHWITPIGVLTVIIVGLIVSFVTGKVNASCLDPDLISPISYWLLPKEAEKYRGTVMREKRQREKRMQDDIIIREMNELKL